MASRPERIAHVLRHLSFGPQPNEVRRLGMDGVEPDALALSLVARAGDTADLPDKSAFEGDNSEQRLVTWWFDRLRSPSLGLHERMCWFWHGHFTSGLSKAPPRLMWQQHLTMREHALGNVRTLLTEMLTDAAMLLWLDGSGSGADSPNENLARESMELFTLGAGNFTEADVKAGAHILTGWKVDWESGHVSFDPESHYDRPVTFLGQRQRWDVSSFVEQLLVHPGCAPFIADRLHRHLVGWEAEPERTAALGQVLVDNDYEILPLIEAMVAHPDLHEARYRRPRQPIEWMVAAMSALGHSSTEIPHWKLAGIGQEPFNPPNVAGWPLDLRWSSPGQVLQRSAALVDLGLPDAVIDAVEPTVDAVLERCSIFDVTDQTREALERAATAQSEFDGRLDLLFVLALSSPEFTIV